jgi:hypothetical protein
MLKWKSKILTHLESLDLQSIGAIREGQEHFVCSEEACVFANGDMSSCDCEIQVSSLLATSLEVRDEGRRADETTGYRKDLLQWIRLPITFGLGGAC